MLCSMTAFATATTSSSAATVACEIRSVNSRFLDINCRLPYSLTGSDERIKTLAGEYVTRGRLDIKLQITSAAGTNDCYEIDLPRAEGYVQALEQLKARFALDAPITLEMLAGLPGLIKPVETPRAPESVWPDVENCLRAALTDLQSMRRREGQTLGADIQERLQMVETGLQTIGLDAADMLAVYQARLLQRIQALTGGLIELDTSRIAQEAALLAERSDISEELVRARSHCRQFETIMQSEVAAGRKLNFLLQELNREINTIGAKTDKALVSRQVVDIKAELEKIREQIQNIE